MYDLETIIAQNRRAARLGIIRNGTAVGTARTHQERDPYPLYVMVGYNEDMSAAYVVRNVMTGEEFGRYTGEHGFDNAWDECHARANNVLENIP